MTRARLILVIAALLATGCASKPKATPPESPTTRVATTGPSTRPIDPKANLTLAELEPRPVMPATAPSTQDSTPPPLEALELFATARDQILRGQRASAVRILEQAIKLDSDSYELWFALGQAQGGVGAASE